MKRLLMLSALAVALAFVSVPEQAVSKGHVPLGKEQVCHKAKVITISQDGLEAHLSHGDCRLPACDFANVFHTGESCVPTNGGDGTCSLANPRDPADGITPGCPPGKF